MQKINQAASEPPGPGPGQQANHAPLSAPADLTVMTDLLMNGFSLSGALWRFLEVEAVRAVWRDAALERPVLEIGCGDGIFTRLALGHVETAIDVEASAVERARRAGPVYGRVYRRDARELTDEHGYQTVLANCVLEHIPGVEGVLRGCARALEAGGHLVATVPLVAMNDHLLLPSRRYAEVRRVQLVHHNLWTAQEWVERLHQSGFAHVDVMPYMHTATCRAWDALDAPMWIGHGRYRFGAAWRRRPSLPSALHAATAAATARWLIRLTHQQPSTTPCAALLLARK